MGDSCSGRETMILSDRIVPHWLAVVGGGREAMILSDRMVPPWETIVGVVGRP